MSAEKPSPPVPVGELKARPASVREFLLSRPFAILGSGPGTRGNFCRPPRGAASPCTQDEGERVEARLCGGAASSRCLTTPRSRESAEIDVNGPGFDLHPIGLQIDTDRRAF